MPNLDFYAVGSDQSAVLGAVFELGLFRVFEQHSLPGNGLREFTRPEDVPSVRFGPHLNLLTVGAGPEPLAHRHEIQAGTYEDATFRYSCEGWGLIQLHFGFVFRETELRWSHTDLNNTEKRAAAWASAIPRLGDPSAWDWAAVTRASNKLNRAIRAMALTKIGAHPVLPQAAQLIAEAGMQYEYGDGIHTAPLPGSATG